MVESDPLRFIGFRALFDSEPELELSRRDGGGNATRSDVDLILLGSRGAQNLFDVMAGLKAARPDLRILVTGMGADDETILKALAAGAKGLCGRGGHARRSSPRPFASFTRARCGRRDACFRMFIERVTSSPGKDLSRPAG